jgi:twitching motility protein PilT
MAKFDGFIAKLFQEQAEALVFETGANVLMKNGPELVPIMKINLTTPQILGTLTEVAPVDARAKANSGTPFTYQYESPSGLVEISVERKGMNIRGTVVRAGAAAAAPPPAPAAPARPAAPSNGSAAPPPPNAARSSFSGRMAAEPPAAPAPPAQRTAPPSGSRSADPAPTRTVEVQTFGGTPESRKYIDDLLNVMLKRRASDVHLSSDNPPMFRIDGEMVPLTDYDVLTPDSLRDIIFSITPEKNRRQWDEIKDTDFAHENELARFRVNVFADRKGIGAVLRQIPNNILTAEQMNISKSILDLCFLPKGLVLVTGPTGSGKSTTLAAIIDYINRNRTDHIITIEDPIEFVHPNKKCLVNQREVGIHTGSFKHALRAALREDPDIVLVGEMRDLETIAIAIETAETGHLVFGTLHTNTAPSTVDRVIDQFPADRQSQIRVMLSESLKAVISQTLCKKIGGGRVPALEVLMVTTAVANLIREGKTFQILSSMQTAKGIGMCVMNDSLLDLVKKKLVEPKDAFAKSLNKADFKTLLEREGIRIPNLAEMIA